MALFPDIQKDIPFNIDQNIPIEVSVIITDKRDKPAIELRKLSSDPEFIKAIIKAAYHDKEIKIIPTFSNKIFAVNSLIQKGIIFYNSETKKYEFTF